MTTQFPGANKFMDRLFRKADNVVWDLMTGRVGIATDDGIATLNGEGDDAQIEINLMDQFGMAIPAFAQSTPVDAVKAGDIIFFGKRENTGWVISRKEGDTGKGPTFELMKVDGTRSHWKAPKISMLGMESGVMVLRSLMTMLPGGNAGLQGMQGMLMPMLMMGGDLDLEKMMPMILMSQMGAQPTVNVDGTTSAATPAFGGNMMQMMMMMAMMKGSSNPFDMFGKKGGSDRFQ